MHRKGVMMTASVSVMTTVWLEDVSEQESFSTGWVSQRQCLITWEAQNDRRDMSSTRSRECMWEMEHEPRSMRRQRLGLITTPYWKGLQMATSPSMAIEASR